MITEKLQGVLEVVLEPLGEGTTKSTPMSFSVIVNSGFLRVVTDVTALGTYYILDQKKKLIYSPSTKTCPAVQHPQ